MVTVLALDAALSIVVGRAFAAQSSTPSGHYVLQGIREVGSALVLREDGRFQYMLAYGAYDEFASATWKLEGERVVLNTEAKDIAPKFPLKSAENKPDKVSTVLVTDKNGRGLAGIDVVVVFEGNRGEAGYTQTYGYQIPVKDEQSPRMVGLGIKMYNLEPQWTKMDGARNYFVFEFDPGRLGQAKFHDQVFYWQEDSLTTERNGSRMRYIKQ